AQSVTANETWSVDVPTALSDGHYTWRVQATDAAGNSSADVSGAAFEVDATAPQEPDLLTLNTDTGDSASDNLTKATTPTLGGHSNEAAHLTVEILDATGQSVLQTVAQSVTANETWSVDVPTALSDGHYTWRVQATDAAGNSSAYVSGAAFEVDTVALKQDSLNLVDNNNGNQNKAITEGDSSHISGHSNEEGELTLELFKGSSKQSSHTIDVNSNDNWDVNVLDGAPEGEYYWQVQSKDVAGNTSEVQRGGILERHILQNENQDTEPGSKVVIDVGGNKYSTTADGDGDWSITIDFHQSGEYDCKVSYTDHHSNTEVVQNKHVTVDFVDIPAELPSSSTGQAGASSASESSVGALGGPDGLVMNDDHNTHTY
ncbi:Ig-like domain-containing protein, partial [Vibrio mediterranei]|uniref:Ig-like domain-containing protein n=1 Tax=Vibrio mediterranei TaxID=689 RepID=UPI001EFE4B7E